MAVRGITLIVLAMVHAGLVLDQAMHNSPVWHEPANLLASIRQVERHDFSTYRVNGAAPRWIVGSVLKWQGVSEPEGLPSQEGGRNEFAEASWFFEAIGPEALEATRWARIALIPVSVVGLLLCYFWGRDLYGVHAGLLAAALWALSPTTLAFASVSLPDMSGAVLGLGGAYVYWLWLGRLTWRRALASGALFGLAAASKATLLIALPLALVAYALRANRPTGVKLGRWQLLSMATMAMAIINAVHGFQGAGRPLGEYAFTSHLLGGDTKQSTANRFAGTWLAGLPVPLPRHYLLGIDEQEADFEKGMWSYMRGQWSMQGWPHYYLYAASMKEPLAILLVVALRFGLVIVRPRASTRIHFHAEGVMNDPYRVDPSRTDKFPGLTAWADRASLTGSKAMPPWRAGTASVVIPAQAGIQAPGLPSSTCRHWRGGGNPAIAPPRDELVVMAFLLALLLIVSMQTGVNKHYRYLLPAIGFLYVWAAGVVADPRLARWKAPIAAAAALLLLAAAIRIHPHELSFFNNLAGGPNRGHEHLLGSNLDWGQDLVHLRDWVNKNPDARPLRLVCDVPYDPRRLGLSLGSSRVGTAHSTSLDSRLRGNDADGDAETEWLAISANCLFDRNGTWSWLRDRAPHDRVGYSIWIFHLSPRDIQDLLERTSP